MSSSDLFESDWESYMLTRDCLKVTKRAIARNVEWLHKTQFVATSIDEAGHRIDQRLNDIEEYVILAMWTVFERYIVDYLKQRVETKVPSMMTPLLQKGVGDMIEYWRFEEKLDLFKGMVESNRIGEAKNIMKYRDWIVHRNPEKGSPGKSDPNTVRIVMSEIINAIRSIDATAP